jgi:hypothetical protein
MLYGLAFIGLASREHVYSLYFQYSSVLFPFFIAAVPDAIASVSEGRSAKLNGLHPARMRWTLACTMLISTIVLSWKYGVIVPNSTFRAGWSPLVREPDEETKERFKELLELIALLPPDAAVSATDSIGPHVATREKIYRWPVLNDAKYALIRVGRLAAHDRRRYERMLARGWVFIDKADDIELLVKSDKPTRERRSAAKKPTSRRARRQPERSRRHDDPRGDAH